MSSQMCVFDRECPLIGQACYSNASWFTQQLSSTGCLCSTYYGFSGANCDETGQTTTSRLWIGLGVCVIVLLATLLLLSVHNLMELGTNRLLATNGETIGTLQLIFASLLGIVSQVGFIWAAFTPSKAGYIPGSIDDDRQNEYHNTWQAFFVVHSVLVFMAAITIALVWLDVARKAQALSKSAGGNLSSYRNRFALFEVTLTIAIVIPISINEQVYGFVIAYFLVLIVVGVYTAGYRSLTRVILSLSSSVGGDSDSRNNPYKPVLDEMRRTIIAIYVVIIITVIIMTATLAIMISGWKNMSPPSGSALLVFTDLLFMATTGIGMSTIIFLRHNTQRRTRKNTKSVGIQIHSDGKIETADIGS